MMMVMVLLILFDPDCSCDNKTYNAQCPIACQYVPDNFSGSQYETKMDIGRKQYMSR